MRDDLVVRGRRRRLVEFAYDVERDMIALRNAAVEIDAAQLRRAGQLDVSFLAHLTRKRVEQRLAGLDAAARQMPTGDVGVLDQEHARLRVDHQRTDTERQAARLTQVEVQPTADYRFGKSSQRVHASLFHIQRGGSEIPFTPAASRTREFLNQTTLVSSLLRVSVDFRCSLSDVRQSVANIESPDTRLPHDTMFLHDSIEACGA